jgi:hypothetical protein
VFHPKNVKGRRQELSLVLKQRMRVSSWRSSRESVLSVNKVSGSQFPILIMHAGHSQLSRSIERGFLPSTLHIPWFRRVTSVVFYRLFLDCPSFVARSRLGTHCSHERLSAKCRCHQTRNVEIDRFRFRRMSYRCAGQLIGAVTNAMFFAWS